jgi:membrane associated rhomboid family serine protease
MIPAALLLTWLLSGLHASLPRVRSCPRCTWPLTVFTHQGVELDHCRRCGGTFLDPGEAASIFGVAAEPQSWREEHHSRPHGTSRLSCPTGHALLEIWRVTFDKDEVEVDVCPRCHGLWIDRDEGAKLFNIVRRSRDHAQAKELGIDKPGLGSYVFQILTGFPIEVWNPVKHRPVVMQTIFALLIMCFCVQLFGGAVLGPEAITDWFALKPADPRPWAFITYGFLHGGFAHILGNLYFLWIFGDNVEDALGRQRFVLLYLVSNFAGGLLHFVFNLGSPIFMLGASGAISGLMGAYLVLFPRVKMWVMIVVVRLKIGVIWYIGFWVGYQVLMAFTGQAAVAWFAHLGGFAAGAAMALYLRNTTVKKSFSRSDLG